MGSREADGGDGDDADWQASEAASLIRRYDTLHRLTVAHGERGRGLYVRKDAGDARPGEALLILPSSSLLHAHNAKTALAPELLPTSERPSHAAHWAPAAQGDKDAGQCHLPLTSVQALTVLLAQWRAKREANCNGEEVSRDPLDVFLESYPRSYTSLPLHWQLFVDSKSATSNVHRTLLVCILDHLPVHVGEQAKDVHRRFQRDVRAIQAVQRHRSDLLPSTHFTLENLAWAWAGVNSRCVYLPLGLTPHADNFTLAPLLDMANHTMDAKRECKVRWLPTKALQLSAPSQQASSSLSLPAGAEVCISYGPHANGFLLAEYGFTIPATLGDTTQPWQGNPYAEVHVDHIVLSMLEKQGSAQAQLKQRLLDDEGYWGQYTIHPHKAPAHPSYRLLLALRLLALDLATSERDMRVAIWRANVQGLRDDCGVEAEQAMHKMLSDDICATIIDEARQRVIAIRQSLIDLPRADEERHAFDIISSDVRAAAEMVVALLGEEEYIAQSLQRAIARGETDW